MSSRTRARSVLRDSQTLRRKIDQDLSANEALIERLTRKLDEECAAREDLELERQQLLERVIELEMHQESRLETDLEERIRDVGAAMVELEEENAELQKLCRELCDALERERESVANGKAEIVCLEQQVEELQALVELLRKS